MPMSVAEYQVSINKLMNKYNEAFGAKFKPVNLILEQDKKSGEYLFPAGTSPQTAKSTLLEFAQQIKGSLDSFFEGIKGPDVNVTAKAFRTDLINQFALYFYTIPGVFENYFVKGKDKVTDFTKINIPQLKVKKNSTFVEVKESPLTQEEFDKITYIYLGNRYQWMYSNPLYDTKTLKSSLFTIKQTLDITDILKLSAASISTLLKQDIENKLIAFSVVRKNTSRPARDRYEYFNAELADILNTILKLPAKNAFDANAKKLFLSDTQHSNDKEHTAFKGYLGRLQYLVTYKPEKKIFIRALAESINLFIQKFVDDDSIEKELGTAKDALSDLVTQNLEQSALLRYFLQYNKKDIDNTAKTAIKTCLEQANFHSDRIIANKETLMKTINSDPAPSIIDIYLELANARVTIVAQRESDKIKDSAIKGTLHQQIDEYRPLLLDLQIASGEAVFMAVKALPDNTDSPEVKQLFEQMYRCKDPYSVNTLLQFFKNGGKVDLVNKFDLNRYCIDFVTNMMKLTRDGTKSFITSSRITPIIEKYFGIQKDGQKVRIIQGITDTLGWIDRAISEIQGTKGGKEFLFFKTEDSEGFKYQYDTVLGKLWGLRQLVEQAKYLRETLKSRAQASLAEPSSTSSSSSSSAHTYVPPSPPSRT